MSESLIKSFLPKWMENLEKSLKAAGGEYYAGKKMSIGDIAVACRLALLKKGFVEGVPMEIFDDYPLLAALCKRVEAEPRIIAYKKKLIKS